MPHSLISYASWQKCLRFYNNEIELFVILDIGPRIIRFGFIDGANEFVEYPDQPSMRNDGKYHSYGGHRLWAAPETEGWTNHPDNSPVEWKEENNGLVCTAPIEHGTKLQKQIMISLDEQQNHVRVVHRITNCSDKPINLSPWSISVMAPGGRAIIPQEKFIAHSERVLPIRSLVMWGYTQMLDPRWTWGNKFIQLRQDVNSQAPQKVGTFISEGWAAYLNQDRIFVKQFPAFPDQTYPDYGSNAEIFTNQRMLEVESLGPLVSVEPHQSVTHQEDWFLYRGIDFGESEEELAQVLKSLFHTILNTEN
jgi:hypothetical protein